MTQLVKDAIGYDAARGDTVSVTTTSFVEPLPPEPLPPTPIWQQPWAWDLGKQLAGGVFVLLLFGGASIKGFAFALLVGIGFGTYSSVFVASALVHDFTKSDTMVDNAKVSQTQTGRARGFPSKAVETLYSDV